MKKAGMILHSVKRFIRKNSRLIIAVGVLIVFFYALGSCINDESENTKKTINEKNNVSECGSDSLSESNLSYASVASDPDTLKKAEEIIIRTGDVSRNYLAITCNVDWGQEQIPEMLNILKENGVKITFFVTGQWAEKNSHLLRQMYMYGHEIQSHGYSHKLCSQISEVEIRENIEKAESAIFGVLGIRTNVFAPPSGDFDERTIAICKEKGYKMSLWSADTIDWREGSTAEVIYDRIMSKELKGAVILMHPKPETVKALPKLLTSFKEQELELVKISEL